jgi:lipopolysaccharide/colanic/teichoic acid biosynthesis glycosyltransferase
MVMNAEQNGPALSCDNDARITKFGQFMRRTHIDEIPQFFNVIIGDMSLVGPRPERQYYINEIRKVAPHYIQLQRIRPGITSWGQVKYGYASDIDQMLERIPFDIIYLKNISLYLDFKILIYTVMNVFQAKGK